MFIRLLLSSTILFYTLHAIPNIEDLKQQVKNNPELLNTPQAQAEMKKRGITNEDVQEKLDMAKDLDQNVTISSKFIENDIQDDSIDNNDTNQTDLISDDINETLLSQRLNPFTFTTNQDLRIKLNKKHLRLTENKLSRYSMRFYTNRNMIDSASMPTPDDYIMASGDELNIYIYGDRNQVYNPAISSDGTIELPFIGPMKIGGMTYVEVKKHLIENLKKHFQLSEFNITINKYSTIQVTLIGDVQHPGLYNVSSFSTVKDVLIASKGLNPTTSVRDIIIKRDGRVIEHLDFYDLLFKGDNFGNNLLKHGDIVLVNQAKKLASVDGYVNNSAIFELKDNENLSDLLGFAGGIKADASQFNIKVTRFSNNSKIETFDLSLKNAKNFTIENGDSVYVYPLDFSSQNSVNIYGNIIRPGAYTLPKEMTLNKLLSDAVKEGAKTFFLPQTYFEYAVIKRYSKDLEYKALSFNITKVLEGVETIELKPQDEIFIFSQNDIFSSKYVTTKGDILLNPGKLQYFEGMSLSDAVHASGIDSTTEDRVKVTSFDTPDLMPKTSFYSLKTQGNTKLSAYDEIEVLDYYDTHALQPISISGEVLHPAIVYYENGMSVQNLIEMAGGLTPKAYTSSMEIVRYYVDQNETRRREVLQIDTKLNPYSKIKLQPYDEVIIFKIPKWNESQTIEIKGEVRFPGKYTIESGEKLSSVLQRAGGFTENAFIDGTVFTRESIKQSQIDQYNKSLAKIKRELAIYNAMPANSKKTSSVAEATSTLDAVMLEAKKYQPVGRISVKLDEDIMKIQEGPYNLVLQDRDTITIPGHIDTVSIFGEVFNPASFVYDPNIDSTQYIELASGYTRAADKSRAYVIHADGTSEPAVSGWWVFSSTLDIKNGDTIVVPIYIQEYNQLELWDSVSRILASFAITAATLNTLGVIK
jgi:polysaccharide export outer membrane protein